MCTTEGECGLKFLVRLPAVELVMRIGRSSDPPPPPFSRLELVPHAASATGAAPSAVSLYRSRRLRCIVALLATHLCVPGRSPAPGFLHFVNEVRIVWRPGSPAVKAHGPPNALRNGHGHITAGDRRVLRDEVPDLPEPLDSGPYAPADPARRRSR